MAKRRANGEGNSVIQMLHRAEAGRVAKSEIS